METTRNRASVLRNVEMGKDRATRDVKCANANADALLAWRTRTVQIALSLPAVPNTSTARSNSESPSRSRSGCKARPASCSPHFASTSTPTHPCQYLHDRIKTAFEETYQIGRITDEEFWRCNEAALLLQSGDRGGPCNSEFAKALIERRRKMQSMVGGKKRRSIEMRG